MNQQSPLVGILIGSDSDWPIMQRCAQQLETFGIPYEVKILSAHRTPTACHEYAAAAASRGLKVLIAAAGMAAALAGVTAAVTPLPVIGVPIASGALAGVDALLATVQMPPGVPVAAVAVGEPGAINAAIIAVQILGTADPDCREKIIQHKQRLAETVQKKNAPLAEKIGQGSK